MLKAIFYARFHPGRGPTIIHQYPPTSILASSSTADEKLLKFSNISSYVIPPYELCNRGLSVCTNGNRVLGFPVSLEDSKYERNRFTFNVCFVLDEDGDLVLWERVVRKTALFFRGMEEENGLLQAEELLEGLKWAGEEGYPVTSVGTLYTLLRDIMQGLNTYGETCIWINELHVLNLRLTTPKPTSLKVQAWDVPLFIRPAPRHAEWTWDLTLQRIHPHIDGVKHVQRIAELADVELRLVKKAMRELLHAELVILLDVFHFQAIYTLTSDFGWFANDESMQEECCKYVATGPTKNILRPLRPTEAQAMPSKEIITTLYQDLHPGFSLYNFCLSHEPQLYNIDIRRFITFGVIKGFLRRVHKYVLATDSQTTHSPTKAVNGHIGKDLDGAWKRAAFSSGWETPPVDLPAENVSKPSTRSNHDTNHQQSDEGEKLHVSLDGRHCTDEICVAMRMNEKKLMEKLRNGTFGDVMVFCK